MDQYINQLIEDIERAILERWNTTPPMSYQLGMMNNFQEPPIGFTGPEFGYANQEEEEEEEWQRQVKFEETIQEAEEYIQPEKAAVSIQLVNYAGLTMEQFPGADVLSNDHCERLVLAISRLLTSYNFMLSKSKVPARFIYPILLEYLAQERSIPKHGFIGIEYCSFDPDICPFGMENCECKDKYNL